jgi:hypothetical protein
MIPSALQHYPALQQDSQQQATKKAQEEHKKRFQQRLAHVTAHENAHASAGGRFAGSPVIIADEYSGHVSGYVPIKMDFGKTAEDAINNAQIISSAAKAPSDPSSQDNAVAAAALSIGNYLASVRRTMEKSRDKKEKKNQPWPAGALNDVYRKPQYINPADNPFSRSNTHANGQFQWQWAGR